MTIASRSAGLRFHTIARVIAETSCSGIRMAGVEPKSVSSVNAAVLFVSGRSGRPGSSVSVTDRLLTTRQVAEYLGFSPETVLRKWRTGEIPDEAVSAS